MSEYYRVFELCNRKSRQNPTLFQPDYQRPDGNDLRDKWGPKSRDTIPLNAVVFYTELVKSIFIFE